jgi:hypothetical protein
MILWFSVGMLCGVVLMGLICLSIAIQWKDGDL